MKILKKIAKWFGIVLILIIAALIIIPIVFKDDIKEMVIDEANKSLKAELSLNDFDLTFISTFPKMTVELTGAVLKGKNEFDGVELLNLSSFKAHVDFWSVVGGDKIEIKAIHIDGLNCNVKVLDNGLANYDIVKSEEDYQEENIEPEESNFELSLKEYSITNTHVSYDDKPGNMSAEIVNLNHFGEGDLTQDIVDFKTNTAIDKISYNMDNIAYLSEVKTNIDLNLLMETTKQSTKFTLEDNKFQLNEFILSLDGFYEMLADKDVMDIKLNTSKTSFKSLLSLIPAFYHSGYEGMISNGKLGINGFVKGEMYDETLPAWDVSLNIADAAINYPDLPGKITNIQLNANSKFPGGANMNDMTVNVNKFHANLSKNTIDATLALRNIEVDPYIGATLKAYMDLATVKNFIPTEDNTNYEGTVLADVALKGNLSSIEQEKYEEFDARGTLNMADLLYNDPSMSYPVAIENILFEFSPQNLSLNEFKGSLGESDLQMFGKIDNYLAYALKDEDLVGHFNFNSDFINLDQLVPEDEATTETAVEQNQTDESSTAPESEETMLVPNNITFDLNTDIKRLKYNGIEIKDIKGKLTIKDEVAELDHFKMNSMDGSIELTGDYNTQNHQVPSANFTYDLNHIDINQLSEHFNSIDKLAPVAKHAHGHISSKFAMETNLTPSLEPVYETLNAQGNIKSNDINLKDHKTLHKISQLTKLESFSNPVFKDFDADFEIKDGKISLTPFDIKTDGIVSNVSGFTTLEQKMDYNMVVNVPKDKIPAEMIKQVEGALSKINNISPYVNMGGLPDFIPVKVKMIGDVANPKITTDFKEAIMKATGDLKDDIIENITETVKDTLNAVKEQVVEDAKEEFDKQKQKIMADAQKQVDQLKLNARKQADNVKKEAKKQGDDLIKQAGNNPLKKAAAKQTAKQLNNTAEKQAQKIIDKADVEADKIMQKAQDRADSIGK